jgi:ribonuclease D
MNPVLLTETSALGAYLDRFSDETQVALDVEFVRQTTYYPHLCLIQMAFANQDPVLIDPFSCDVTVLGPLLTNPNVLKIVHDGKQDVEALRYALSVVPAPLFDAQLAAAFCGMGSQIRYEKLVRTLCDSSFSQIKTPLDWKRRPLPTGHLHYAAEDVHYLNTIYQGLTERLNQTGRRAWFDEDMAALERSFQTPLCEHDMGEKFKVGHLPYPHVPTARALVVVRDRIARHKNMARRRLLSDEGLLAAASRGAEAAMQLFPEHTDFWQDFDALCALFKKAPPSKAQDEEAVRFFLLSAALKDVAQKSNLPESLLANREALRVFGKAPSPLDQGWRAEVAGNLLRSIQQGDVSVRLSGEVLVYETQKKPSKRETLAP